MPPSSEQDSVNTPGGTPQSNKPSQRITSAGAQVPTRSGRKNGAARDSGDGGVLAAVTKNASKSSSTKPSTLSSRFQSPDTKHAASSNGNPLTSPMLDALSAAAMVPSTSQSTDEWAKNLEALSSSPNNLVNLSESPVTQPSSYEDRHPQMGWTIREQSGTPAPNGHSPSASPPTARRRPTSYHVDGNYPQSTEDLHPQASSPYAARRSSMYSQHSRYGPQPPLPHQAQAHFFGAPDANFLLPLPPTGPGLVPGDNGYYCGFDSLPTLARDSPKPVDNVVLVGYDRGVDVYAVSKRGLSKLYSLDGLRGGVYNAKVLPWSFGGSSHRHYPLIAVVVHGPVKVSDNIPGEEGISSSPDNPRGQVRAPTHEADGSPIGYYQTTVEVYSLGNKQHVATLLSVPKTQLTVPTISPLFRAPPPVGALTIRADRGYLVVASGTTGETWIFRQEGSDSVISEAFKCFGKVWTAIQQGLAADSTGHQSRVDVDWSHTNTSPARQQYRSPILSLNGRWLAYSPPAPSSQISLKAVVPAMYPTGRIPGLNGQAPPQLPPVNCLVEMPGGESMMKQLAQAATQEVIKGATYIGKQGVQAWNNYWNKPPSYQNTQEAVQYQTHQNIAHQFPPTHGMPNQSPAVNKDPGLISILDLDSLARSSSSTGTSPHPLATFKVPHGCSFLSFAPSGLALFTASCKGDMQFVWDIMRIQYTRSSFLRGGVQGNGNHSPHVRQIAHFSRMTIARIVDVVWTSPHGERAAMVTEPGTVHILDLPVSAFTWPPPRRRASARKSDEDTASTALSAAGVASSAVSSLWTAARPLVSRQRRSSAGISAISAANLTSQAGHGTQALAAGISRSVGAATGRMNELRKSGSPKLHLPRSAVTPSRACIRLLSERHSDLVLVVGGGVVGLYTVKGRRADRPADKQKASKGAKYVEFKLPTLPSSDNPAAEATGEVDQGIEFTEKDLETARPQRKQSKLQTAQSHAARSSIPQAEIESNAPYQPFHTDQRVGLYVYSYRDLPTSSSSISTPLSLADMGSEIPAKPITKPGAPWSFGGRIGSVRLDVGPAQKTEDSFYAPSDHRAPPPGAMERVTRVTDHSDEIEQIVVTTRMRKGGRGGTGEARDADDEGFFEDDCEVLDFASQRV